jgi:glyoxylase-like metal-dependent hydrolase (beta-lactamase superfamily II)
MFLRTIKRIFAVAAATALIASIYAPVQAQDVAPEREITNIRGDLYSFRQGRHLGMFLVTEEGIVVLDPTNHEAAGWLKEQLDERFGLPVKYVIYSHSHNDHASGGDVFADTAIFVGHENIEKNLQRPSDDAPLLAREQLWDSNGDGRIQESEAGGYIGVDIAPDAFARYDVDQSGWLSRAEIWAARFGGGTVRAPDIYYSDYATIRLGGKTVELHYLGYNHSDDMTVVRFTEERVIHTVDSLTPNRLPWRTLDGVFLPEWINWLYAVAELDFDIVVPGHESPGTKEDVLEQAVYLEELRDAVAAAIAEGKSVEEMVDTILMGDYADMIEYESSRALNVLGVYELLITAQDYPE